MPRKIAEPYVQWKVSVPGTLAARVELLLFDVTHGKPRYAERSKLISDLLQAWIDARGAPRGAPNSPSEPSHA